MTVAKGLFAKTERETKSIVIDCQGSMAPGETIATVGTAVISPTGPTVDGLAKNLVPLAKAGKRTIGIGEGLRFFLLGGESDTVYTITIPYTTSEDQDLDASVKVKVLADD